jgi:lipopolysaccharide transport system permease protein
VQDSTASVVSQYRLIRQIAFPKIVLPVASTTAGIAGFAFGLIPLVGMLLFYQDRISPLLILYPVVALVQYVFTLAIAIVVAAGNVFFRDLGNVTRHLLRIWFYLSPGLYSLAHLNSVGFIREHPIVRDIAAVNPFAVLFDAYRRLAYGTEQGPPVMPSWPSLAILLVVSTAMLAVAIVVFKRLEPNFAKVL